MLKVKEEIYTYLFPFQLDINSLVRLLAMPSLENKIIAVTGAAAGMGFATAKHLISCGARVSICDVQEVALAEAEAILQKIPTSATKPVLFSRIVDVAKVAEVDNWIGETVKTLGRLDGAANMAGTGVGVGNTPLLQMSDRDWDVSANFACCLLKLGLRDTLEYSPM